MLLLLLQLSAAAQACGAARRARLRARRYSPGRHRRLCDRVNAGAVTSGGGGGRRRRLRTGHGARERVVSCRRRPPAGGSFTRKSDDAAISQGVQSQLLRTRMCSSPPQARSSTGPSSEAQLRSAAPSVSVERKTGGVHLTSPPPPATFTVFAKMASTMMGQALVARVAKVSAKVRRGGARARHPSSASVWHTCLQRAFLTAPAHAGEHQDRGHGQGRGDQEGVVRLPLVRARGSSPSSVWVLGALGPIVPAARRLRLRARPRRLQTATARAPRRSAAAYSARGARHGARILRSGWGSRIRARPRAAPRSA